jgi:DNA-binding SARP family transcriptional activator
MGDETQRGTMVRVLGPVDLLTSAGTVPVGGRRARALLGALVVGAGHAVPVDQLREALWHDEPPGAADSTLQSYVSSLRHLLGAEAIARTDHCYELDLDRVDVDALRFERLLRRADEARDDPDERWRLSREALGLWRGQPFGDLGDDDPFRLEACRLDELRLAAMELNLEADLALGRHELVVGELESAVEEHPYRERLWYLLVRALALGDRRVEALRRCSELRRILGETGIGPSAEIVDLERAILDDTLQRPG